MVTELLCIVGQCNMPKYSTDYMLIAQPKQNHVLTQALLIVLAT